MKIKILLFIFFSSQLFSKNIYKPYETNIEYTRIGSIKLYSQLYRQEWKINTFEICKIVDNRVDIIEDENGEKFYYPEVKKGIALKYYNIFIMFPGINNIKDIFYLNYFNCIIYIYNIDREMVKVDYNCRMQKYYDYISFTFEGERLDQVFLVIRN